MLRVLLVDDHALVRAGVRKLLEDTGRIEVVGEAGCGEDALLLTERLRPDIVLMDNFMPGIGGFEASRRILAKGSARVIVLTVCSEAPLSRRLLDIGAHGYLTKDCTSEEIIDALQRVQQGQRYVAADIARRLALGEAEKSSPFDALSEREWQVAMMLMRGDSNQLISDQLKLSTKTVSTYRSRILQKVGARNEVDLVRLGVRYGLVDTVEH